MARVRFARAVLLAVVAIVLIGLGASFALHSAGAELIADAHEQGGETVQHTAFGRWLAPRLAPDAATLPVEVRDARGQAFHQLADRVVEAASVIALLGVVLGLLLPSRTSAAGADQLSSMDAPLGSA
jgi:hypothetical protein